MKTKNNASGFALIEVLLAVVVLAIGLLAGSRMQILGLNFTQGALSRSHAAMAANDIIDRMRLNVPGVLNNDYDGVDTRTLPNNPNCLNAGCTSAQLAQTDIFMWGSYFGLGDGTGTSVQLPPDSFGLITGPDANGVMTVRIEWNDLIQGTEENRNVEIDVVINRS